MIEVAPGIKVVSLSLTRNSPPRGKRLAANLEDGRSIDLGLWARTFTQSHFRNKFAESEIFVPRLGVMQWDQLTARLLTLTKYGGR